MRSALVRRLGGAGLIAAAVLVFAPIANAHHARLDCFGQLATILGTPAPDFIVGTSGNDIIQSLRPRAAK